MYSKQTLTHIHIYLRVVSLKCTTLVPQWLYYTVVAYLRRMQWVDCPLPLGFRPWISYVLTIVCIALRLFNSTKIKNEYYYKKN